MQTLKVKLEEYLNLVESDNQVTLFRGEDYLPCIEDRKLVLYDTYGARHEVEVDNAPFME